MPLILASCTRLNNLLVLLHVETKRVIFLHHVIRV